MSKRTPGPWHVEFTRFSDVKAENGAIVAKCNKLTGLVNLQANARLIAAAPDLLEALRAAVRQNDNDMLMTGEELRACRAAIAKAEGAQQ